MVCTLTVGAALPAVATGGVAVDTHAVLVDGWLFWIEVRAKQRATVQGKTAAVAVFKNGLAKEIISRGVFTDQVGRLENTNEMLAFSQFECLCRGVRSVKAGLSVHGKIIANFDSGLLHPVDINGVGVVFRNIDVAGMQNSVQLAPDQFDSVTIDSPSPFSPGE